MTADPTAPGAAIVVLGAGSGSRMGAEVNKVLLPLAGVPVLARSLIAALAVPGVRRVVLAVRSGEETAVRETVAPHLAERDEVLLVEGGGTRHASERAALAALRPLITDGEVDVVAIHDGARPLAPSRLFAEAIEAAREHGGALPVLAAPRLMRRDGAPNPLPLLAVHTPQAFRAEPLLAAYDEATSEGFEGTDTASCLERYRPDVRIVGVDARATNLKVTWPGDVRVAEALLP